MADTEQELLNEAVRETEAEILNAAFSNEPIKDEPVVEEQQPEQARDESGKFTAKEAEQKTEPEKVEKAEPEPDEHGQIPSWRLREVAEERRLAKAEAEAERQRRTTLESEVAQMRQQLQALQKPAEQPKQDDIDPLIDPQGFAKRIETQFESKLREIQLNNNLAIAHVKHGDKFEAAYNAFLQTAQQGDKATYQSVMNSPNPGEAMVRWHAQQETLKEVGSDPAAYKNRILEEAMKDPSFQAKVIELVKGSNGNSQQRPSNVTQLPPSLSRATGSSRSASAEDDTDNSERAVFDYAFR